MKLTAFIFAAMIFSLSNLYAQSSPGFQSSNYQYLTGVLTSAQSATLQTAKAWNSVFPPKFYSLSVTTTASSFAVNLEGSLDNANWSVIAVTTSALGITSNPLATPMLYFRIRASTIAANTSITATAIGVP